MTDVRNLKSKVCLVGDIAVGKTSLIDRYVVNSFDDRYLTTLGTKVTKKVLDVPLPDADVVAHMDMTIWDIMGQQGFRQLLQDAYFFGVRGVLAVADITRRITLDDLAGWIESVEHVAGKVPVLIAINKADLVGDAEFGAAEIERMAASLHSEYLMTSAKTGENVEEAFRRLGELVARRQVPAAPVGS